MKKCCEEEVREKGYLVKNVCRQSQGKRSFGQGKVREKSGNLPLPIWWPPCIVLYCIVEANWPGNPPKFTKKDPKVSVCGRTQEDSQAPCPPGRGFTIGATPMSRCTSLLGYGFVGMGMGTDDFLLFWFGTPPGIDLPYFQSCPPQPSRK